ncbi:MFS transporter [Streptomonospora nanhaiensis]|uniref:EmrB/QacA subfamily drug resistance transporter n=1 Tax=Streptomonospora nanhaiensis TaxID=1323731 RepID=A0A853BSW6_9ACTN|nr:MFS transporter [Streptomonospora nanhaiensis]MBV2362826.1 MFS transporter [Streptomonospora nanhaiensis]MBX9386995.1 MFS transporter [Streptomonospora nanhaiensis]NUL60527.1 MFS transporter [Brevibacterium luteolum]NYI97816.1 EmrB/QacA subfamily drug resistance transporter [Streptomonospora nanhaiensis]
MKDSSVMSGPDSARKPGPTLTAVNGVQLLVSLDLCIVNVALPDIAAGLGFESSELSWVIHAYALTFGGLLLLGGKVADLLGHRRVLIIGLLVFALSSLLAGLATSPGVLVAARGLQGVGAAAMQPASLAVLTTTFPEGRARARAFGIWSAVNALGAALGVVLGGVVTELAGWRWVMLLNVPVALVPLWLAWRSLPGDARVVRAKRPDVLGGALATTGMTALVYGVVRAADLGWTAPQTIVVLAGAALLLALFVVVERSPHRDPLLRLGLLANRSVTGANVINLLIGAAMASCFYILSLYVQTVLGNSPAVAGLMFLPFALGVIVGAVVATGVGRHLPPRSLMLTGVPLTAVGFMWFGFMRPDGSFLVDVLGPSLVASIGFGLCLGPVVSTATRGVDDDEAGMASGLLSSARQIGASVGLAVLGTLAQHRTGSELTAETLTAGYGLAMHVAAWLLLLGAGGALLVLPSERALATSTTARR